MAPVLSLSIDSIMACKDICDLYTREMFESQWAGETSHELDWFVNPPEHIRPIVPDRDKVWMMVAHMSRRKRLRFNLIILTKAEQTVRDRVTRNTLGILSDFLDGTATKDQVKAQRLAVQEHMYAHLDNQTSKKFKMLNCVRHLMNPKDSQRSTMRILRFLEGHSDQATYYRFLLLAVKILKEEIAS